VLLHSLPQEPGGGGDGGGGADGGSGGGAAGEGGGGGDGDGGAGAVTSRLAQRPELRRGQHAEAYDLRGAFVFFGLTTKWKKHSLGSMVSLLV